MSDPHVLFERDGHVAVVTMNRPDARNALSSEMVVRLADAWAAIDADPNIRVAILTGAGGHFSSGADLKAMAAGYGEDEWHARTQADPEIPWKALLRQNRPRKPLIAAVEGYAIAGGTEMLQATEIRIAGRSARFGLFEVSRGLFPIGGSTVRLRRQIAYTHAAEILLTGEMLDAQRALEIGLIGRVVDDGAALDEARAVADRIAANGPLAVQAILRSLRETEGLPEADALKIELEIGLPIFMTYDAKEGPRAFAEKRAPNFEGR